ncbi:hypothetical protein [Acinetobacter nosocomialis]|uniref:hypothetical protein n=1 Tax=Acinetobacter nosocomialis TaxID=106654 RepID=UPI00209082F0|nr:hypothetical protein [Acinetobacter nosocomialis]MDE1703625.1 hypothetical protein [Acinetobacter nosocomialis]
MDDRNLELEAWLIETAGEEMMANHLGPNWNRFDEEFGFYPNMAMTVADLVWQHQQAKVEELKASHHGEVIGHEVHFKKIKQERDELQTLYIQQGINMLKLQKRVDAALAVLTEYYTGSYDESPDLVVDIEQALKGEG